MKMKFYYPCKVLPKSILKATYTVFLLSDSFDFHVVFFVDQAN